MHPKFAILPAALLSLCVSSAAFAQQKYEHRACYNGPHQMIAHSKEAMSGTYHVTAMVIAEQSDPLHMAAGTCGGYWLVSEGQYEEKGSCEYTLPSGDKVFGVYARKNQDNGSWKVVGGTGKMKNLVHSGSFMPFTDFPQVNGQLSICGREWGTWKLSQN